MNTFEDANKKLTTLIYALYAISLILGITSIAAIIMNYVKRDDMAGTWLESHFRWQIRTFWFTLLWAFVGGVTTLIGVGFVILGVDCIWFIYRIVKGWINLNENKSMYTDS